MSIDPKNLRVGQAVAVREMNHGVRLDPPAADEAGLTVAEVGPEHLVLDNAAGGSRMSIPLYLIHKPAPAPAVSPEAA